MNFSTDNDATNTRSADICGDGVFARLDLQACGSSGSGCHCGLRSKGQACARHGHSTSGEGGSMSKSYGDGVSSVSRSSRGCRRGDGAAGRCHEGDKTGRKGQNNLVVGRVSWCDGSRGGESDRGGPIGCSGLAHGD